MKTIISLLMLTISTGVLADQDLGTLECNKSTRGGRTAPPVHLSYEFDFYVKKIDSAYAIAANYVYRNSFTRRSVKGLILSREVFGSVREAKIHFNSHDALILMQASYENGEYSTHQPSYSFSPDRQQLTVPSSSPSFPPNVYRCK